MLGGGRVTTEAYAAYAAGRSEDANDADGPSSSFCAAHQNRENQLKIL